jgi:hypothetical protein
VQLSPRQIERLTYELSVEVGWFFWQEERARLQKDLPNDIDAFTDEVIRIAGYDPYMDLSKVGRRNIKERVLRYFREIEDGELD